MTSTGIKITPGIHHILKGEDGALSKKNIPRSFHKAQGMLLS